MPPVDPGPEEDFARELAARRRDLEREFDDKQRELKAQHQRRMDALRQEQADWEEVRRQRTKELADREEKLRRGEERLHKDTHKTVTAKDEAGALRRKVEAMEADRRAEAEADVGREARVLAAQATAQKARRAARWLALVAVLGPIAWLVAGGREAGPTALVVATVSLVAAIGLAFSRVDLKD
jgi:septal ring factor EnvC (AmiA/AmiB activator)